MREVTGDEVLWTEDDLAEFLRIEPQTAAVWRTRRIGPPALRISRRCVRYDPAAVRAWLAQVDHRPEPVSA